MNPWVLVPLGAVTLAAFRAVAHWRQARNLRVRRALFETFTADGYFTQLIDFVEMQVIDHAKTPDPTLGIASWPRLHELRRLDGPRWQSRPHPSYIAHRIANLRNRANREEPTLRLIESERRELEQLASGNAPWEDWGWGNRAEPAYQRFLREYRPAKQKDKRRKVRSVEDTYMTLWQSEADRVGA